MTPTTRQANITRQKILAVATQEIYVHGFQASSIGDILKKAQISKGALYHHFATKQALGYAVLDEALIPMHQQMWQPALQHSDPIPAIIELLQQMINAITPEKLRCGCPLNNLAQEMSPIDEGFRKRINCAISAWCTAVANALARGQQQGLVRTDINHEQTAAFLIASIEGTAGLAKNAQDKTVYTTCMGGIIWFLRELST